MIQQRGSLVLMPMNVNSININIQQFVNHREKLRQINQPEEVEDAYSTDIQTPSGGLSIIHPRVYIKKTLGDLNDNDHIFHVNNHHS